MRTPLLSVAGVLLLFACQQKPKEETSETSGQPVPGKVATRAVWPAVQRLPLVKLPFQFNYKYAAGIEMTTDSVLYDVLQGATTKPVVKRVIGHVVNRYNASVYHVFWFGKQYPEVDFWRAYVTTIYIDGTVNYSMELDASREDNERCDPKVTEHWTVVNDHFECRSVINSTTSCSGDTDGEVIRTFVLDVNQPYDTDNPHPFPNFPLKLPAAAPMPGPTGDLAYFTPGYVDAGAAGHIFYKDRPTGFDINRIHMGFPDQLDGRDLYGAHRRGVYVEGLHQFETQIAIVSGERVDNNFSRLGKPVNFSIPEPKDGETGGGFPDFMVLHDHFLRLHGAYSSADGGKEYTYWIVRQGYDLKFLEDLGFEMLRVERNYVFARYGYIFKSSDLTEYFKQFAWYEPKYQDVNGYLLTEDKALIARIQELEERR